MSDLSITAANVVPGSNAVKEDGIAGATITAGQAVYKDTTTNTWKLADADSATAAVRMSAGGGIALNGASSGQRLQVLRSGAVTIGATLTHGSPYYLSPNPGGIGLIAEVLTGDYIVRLGDAISTTVLYVNIVYTGATA